MGAATFLTAFAALAGLALGMPAHRRAALSAGFLQGLSRGVLVSIGWTLCCGALALSVRGYGWAVGTVFWFAGLATAGFVVTLLLTYRPRALPVFAAVSLVAAAAVLALV